MKKISRRIVTFMILMLGTYLLSSCEGNRSLDIVEQAISQLDQQPNNWNEILSTTLTDLDALKSELAKNVRSEVDAIYSRALEQTESSRVCGEEFVGTRIKHRLQAVLYKHNNSKPNPEIVPVVCSTNPKEVRAGVTNFVHYYGFDFMEFNTQENFLANVQYKDNGELSSQFRPQVNISRDDHLIVDLQSITFDNLYPTRGLQLVLSWKEEKVAIEGAQSEIAIILPSRRVITVQGGAEIVDDELIEGNDVIGELVIFPRDVLLSPSAHSFLQFDKCVGDEVRLEIDLDIKAIGYLTVEIKIEAKLYEGNNCDTDDLEDEINEVVYLLLNEHHKEWQYTLVNTEYFGGDQADITLEFTERVP